MNFEEKLDKFIASEASLKPIVLKLYEVVRMYDAINSRVDISNPFRDTLIEVEKVLEGGSK